ncbi:MAG: hypothetical protein JSS40_10830 [Proteobacteria bacterium]|nr:hypothetical protein [Pseudomonadota bacterium]
MNRFRTGAASIMLACQLAGGVAPAHAEASNVELVAIMGGRIIGAAKACSINAERIRKTADRMLAVVNSRATSEAERKSALGYFETAQGAGAEQVRSERSRCNDIHVDFSEIEVKLGRVAGTDAERVAARRGIPPLGALKAEAAATQRQ